MRHTINIEYIIHINKYINESVHTTILIRYGIAILILYIPGTLNFDDTFHIKVDDQSIETNHIIRTATTVSLISFQESRGYANILN